MKHLICETPQRWHAEERVPLILKTDMSNQRQTTRVSYGLPFMLFSVCYDRTELEEHVNWLNRFHAASVWHYMRVCHLWACFLRYILSSSCTDECSWQLLLGFFGRSDPGSRAAETGSVYWVSNPTPDPRQPLIQQHMGPRSSLLVWPSSLIHSCQGWGVGLWWELLWAQASPTDWYRTIVTPLLFFCWNEKASLWSWPAKLRRQSFSNIGFLAKWRIFFFLNNTLLNDDITKMRSAQGSSMNIVEFNFKAIL